MENILRYFFFFFFFGVHFYWGEGRKKRESLFFFIKLKHTHLILRLFLQALEDYLEILLGF